MPATALFPEGINLFPGLFSIVARPLRVRALQVVGGCKSWKMTSDGAGHIILVYDVLPRTFAIIQRSMRHYLILGSFGIAGEGALPRSLRWRAESQQANSGENGAEDPPTAPARRGPGVYCTLLPA